MATNRDKLKNLMTDFIGTNKEEGQIKEERQSIMVDRSELTAEKVARYEITPEMEARLNAVRRLKTGRPKGRGNGNPKEREHRATFIVRPEVIQRVKYIALAESRLFKIVIDEALTRYIEQWEQTNGKIRIKTKRK